ncbi:FYVE, RhoGEF and PH domain-containing protein 6 [Hypsibius exemplaris]|uniref:FYVE, RhoGEF and PH domain-containing protein 6 n=1 Tax=Hypsibius exemplaris TaxID=2072580 RepID=A0A1W0XAQ5_HYPEX|nr:FYVE, RhoGEF and PH domain-containing protein 6 [Hypsibius exemplaris]
MTAKPAVPPKPKLVKLSAKESRQLVAPLSDEDAPPPPPPPPPVAAIISSPFDTEARAEPQFFYKASASSNGFKSYLGETASQKMPVAGKTATGRRSSLPDATVHSVTGNTRKNSRKKMHTSKTSFFTSHVSKSPAKVVEPAEVGLQCGSAFAEAKRKFAPVASCTSPTPTAALSNLSHASSAAAATSSVSTSSSYQSCDARRDEEPVSINQLSNCDSVEVLNREDVSVVVVVEGHADAYSVVDTVNQSIERLDLHSDERDLFMGVTEADIAAARTEQEHSIRTSMISNATISSTDSEKSSHGLGNGEGERTLATAVPSDKAYKVATEIVETEYKYLQSLRLLLVEFPAAVQGSIPPEDITLLLRGLPQLEKLCVDIYEDLQAHLEVYSTERLIAPVFLKKGKVLLLYVHYVNDFERLIDTYQSLLRKYPNFADMVAKFEASPVCKKIPLVEYFHKPIQRLPRYPLLLATYMRALEAEEDHPDRRNAKDALELVASVTLQANTTLASVEKAHKLLWYQARTIGYTFLRSNRTFIRDGTLKKLSRKAPQDRIVLLCSDAIICGEFDSITGMKFTVNAEYPLTEIRVEHLIDPDYFERDLEFGIYSTKKSFVFQAHSIEERNAWITAISRATEDRQKLNARKAKLRSTTTEDPLSFAPIWIPDYRVDSCQLCRKQFSLFRRYHHCRLCGYAVCGSCSPHEVGIDYKDNRPKRVCLACFSDPAKNPDLSVVADQNR